MNSDKSGSIRLRKPVPSLAQRRYLQKGAQDDRGKLPLFDRDGQRYCVQTVEACVSAGWVKPIYKKTFLRDMDILEMTDEGCQALASIDDDNVVNVDWTRVVRSPTLV